MRVDVEMVDPLHERFDLLDARIAEFDHRAALLAEDVVVLTVPVGTLVLALVLPDLVFLHQAAFHQQVQRVVNGGA
jgi:hypothetical protein